MTNLESNPFTLSRQQQRFIPNCEDRPDPSLSPQDYAKSIWMRPTQERIAKELRALPPEQRELVWADLTANPRISRYKLPTPEDPMVVSQKLAQLNEAVHKLPRKQAYELAERMAPDYVNDKSFQTMFLRADRFDVRAAALRIIRHFEAKRKLFGDALLGRDIRLSDLNADDLHSLNNGAYQTLPRHDQAGRRVFWARYSRMIQYRARTNMYRALWYVNFNAAKEDEQTQLLGMVRIMSFLDGYPSGGPDQELNRMVINLMNCLPNRIVALYFLFEDNLWSQTLDLMNHMLNPLTRLRTRTIFGSLQECTYALSCLGIPNALGGLHEIEDADIDDSNDSGKDESSCSIDGEDEDDGSDDDRYVATTTVAVRSGEKRKRSNY